MWFVMKGDDGARGGGLIAVEFKSGAHPIMLAPNVAAKRLGA